MVGCGFVGSASVFGSANVSGIPLSSFCELRGHFAHREAENEIAEKVKNSAYDIIQRKRATYFGVAMAVKRICEVIVRNIVGSGGIEVQVPVVVLNDEEKSMLQDSARILKETISTLDI